MKRLPIIIVCIVMLVSCGKTKPQAPANTPEIDTIGRNLLFTNQLLVEETNEKLTNYILKTKQDFVLHDNGFWYRWLKRTDAEQIKLNDIVDVSYQVYLLDSTHCVTKTEQVTVGKKEVVGAIDAMLILMKEGEQVEIIAPWYSAYGQKGDEYVLPYTDVRICLSAIEPDYVLSSK